MHQAMHQVTTSDFLRITNVTVVPQGQGEEEEA